MKTILHDLLTAAGSRSVDYEEIACAVLLHSLPAEYGAQRTAITEKKLSTLDEIEIELLKEEQIPQASHKGMKKFEGEFSGAASKSASELGPPRPRYAITTGIEKAAIDATPLCCLETVSAVTASNLVINPRTQNDASTIQRIRTLVGLRDS